MSSQYSVIHYAPDFTTGEGVNIGVVTMDTENAKCQFLTNWTRAENFVGATQENMQRFIDELQRACSGYTPDNFKLNSLNFAGSYGMWQHSIQFTPLRGSIWGYEELLEAIVKMFLIDGEYAVRFEEDIAGEKPVIVGYHPELPGCMAQGDTIEEATENLRQARKEYIELRRELGWEPRGEKAVKESQEKYLGRHSEFGWEARGKKAVEAARQKYLGRHSEFGWEPREKNINE